VSVASPSLMLLPKLRIEIAEARRELVLEPQGNGCFQIQGQIKMLIF